MFQSSIKTELVIAMTLAETFLLLVFVVWYGQTAKAAGPHPDWQTVAEQRQREIDRLTSELAEQKRIQARMNKAIEFWQKNFNIVPPASREELQAALRSPEGKGVRIDLARGYPSCEEQNVLVNAMVRNGAVRMSVVADSDRLRQWANSAGVLFPRAGTVMEDLVKVRQFLSAVGQFYGVGPDKQKACRFDYQLAYESKEDYYDGRETFERFFYPAGISRVGPQTR